MIVVDHTMTALVMSTQLVSALMPIMCQPFPASAFMSLVVWIARYTATGTAFARP